MLLRSSIERLMQKENLDAATCQSVLQEMLDDNVNTLQTAAFLTLLRAKPETAEELYGFVNALKQQMQRISTREAVLDIVGTGGDGANTVNISTGSAILAASCGVKIVKHGNRAVSSIAGSADVLEALGVNIHLSPEKIGAGVEKLGIGFCFAPQFHPALAKLRTLRKTLQIATTFNLLGPLLNPAEPQHILLGVMHENLMGKIAKTLQMLNVGHSMVVFGNGLDEISCIGPLKILEIKEKNIHEKILDPASLGFAYCQKEALKGGAADLNAKILLDVFAKGKNSAYHAVADTLILNAGVAVYLYGLQNSLSAGVELAREKLYQGVAFNLLQKWVKFSHE